MDSSDKLPRHLFIAFAMALLIYAGFFSCDQGIRRRKGGWDVSFQTNSAEHAAIMVNQSALQLTNIQIVFDGDCGERGHFFGEHDPPLRPLGKTPIGGIQVYPDSEAAF